MTQHPTFPEVYQELISPQGICPQMVRRTLDAILSGAWSPVKVGAFAATLHARGETAETLGEAALSMRQAMLPVEHGLPKVMDTCGTGGDGLHTVNVSTVAALIVAAAGVPVAKHGNRAASSKAGSADVLEALGVPTQLPAQAAAELLREVGIAFMLAPTHHPAMRHAAEARRELGIRTLFNCLGPLANPARATHQLLGVYDDALRGTLARALAQLGSTRAWVVRGEDGLDEVSPFGPTRVTELADGSTRDFVVTPEDFGLRPSPPGALAGDDAAHNARIIEVVLSGQPHPATDGCLINGAAALVVALDLQPRAAAEQARELLASGAVAALLERWRAAARARAALQALP